MQILYNVWSPVPWDNIAASLTLQERTNLMQTSGLAWAFNAIGEDYAVISEQTSIYASWTRLLITYGAFFCPPNLSSKRILNHNKSGLENYMENGLTGYMIFS